MGRTKRQFSSEFKTKLVLELLEGEHTLNQVASKYDVLPKSLQQWKKQFIENASIAFEPAKAVKEYKDEIKAKEAEIEELQKQLGKSIIEKEWLAKKLKSLDSLNKRALVVRADALGQQRRFNLDSLGLRGYSSNSVS